MNASCTSGRRRPWSSPCAALFVALSGVGYTAIVLPANSVGTKHLKKNAVTSPKVKGLVTSDFKPGQLPPRLSAYVSSTGTLRGGHGVVASSRLSDGNFSVTFNQSIANCAATANYLRESVDSSVERVGSSRNHALDRGGASHLHLEFNLQHQREHPVRADRGLLSNTTVGFMEVCPSPNPAWVAGFDSNREMGPPGLEPGTNGL